MERRRAAKKKWRDKNKEEMQRCRETWASQNIPRIRAAAAANKNRKYYEDPQFKAELLARNIIRSWLFRPPGKKKMTRGEQVSGAKKGVVRAYLESLFTDGMTWDNHGFHGWHIHHKKPCSQFDLTDPIQLKECFHYTNWEPLWSEEHLKAHGKESRVA